MLAYILLQNKVVRGLQIGAGFSDYRSGQEGLQIRAASGILSRGKKITNRGRGFKSGQRDFKSEQRDFKSEQRDFKSGQRLQIGARGISNQDRDYKSGQNKGKFFKKL